MITVDRETGKATLQTKAEYQAEKAERRKTKWYQRCASCCCCLLCLATGPVGAFCSTLCFCFTCCIKRRRKGLEAQFEIELPAMFDSSEVSSDSVSTDEETRAIEAKAAVMAPGGAPTIITEAQRERWNAREEQMERRVARAMSLKNKSVKYSKDLENQAKNIVLAEHGNDIVDKLKRRAQRAARRLKKGELHEKKKEFEEKQDENARNIITANHD